jgi:toxin ParE1/3/4
MRIGYHPLVEKDVDEILDHYEGLSVRLADDFRNELRRIIDKAAASPLRFPPAGRYRRANLHRFPYHILYELGDNQFRIMIVRHNKRHPRYGTGRR